MNVTVVVVTTADVRRSVASAREHGERFFDEIVWQIEHRVWGVLGYASWDEMRQGEYADMGVVVPRADRPELVARLRRTGLSQQTIGDTLGVPETTVRRDLNRQMADEDPPPTITNARGQERPASYTRQPPQDYGEDNDRAALAQPAQTHPPAQPRQAELTRRDVLDGQRAERYDAQKRCEHMGFALGTLHLLTVPEERQRIHQAWALGADGATPTNRAYHTPATMRDLAAALVTYANEEEARHG